MTDAPERELQIQYSRGRDKFDAYPEQRTAASFSGFASAVLADRAQRKGLIYISAPFARNGDGRHHRSRDGVLPRGFMPLDLDGADPVAFVELGMWLCAYSGFGYTTASHTAESPHARYILELSRPVDRSEGIRLGQVMQQRIEARLEPGALKFDDSVYRGEQPIYGPLVNADVMYYGGAPIDVDAVLATAPEEPLRVRPAPPDPYRARLLQLGIVLRELEPGKDAITCPFVGDHSPEDGASARIGSDTSTVYFWPLYGGCKWGRIHCLHGHCNERNKDQRLYLEKLGLDPKEVWRGQAGGAAPYEDDLPPVEVYVEDARRGNGKEGRGGNSDSSHHDKRDDAADATGGSTRTEPGLTDLGNAHRFDRDHRENVRYCWPWAKWLVWNGRYWCRDDTGEVHRLAEATVRGLYEEAARSSQDRREALGKWAVKCESHERRIKMLASAQAIEGIPIRPEEWTGIHGC